MNFVYIGRKKVKKTKKKTKERIGKKTRAKEAEKRARERESIGFSAMGKGGGRVFETSDVQNLEDPVCLRRLKIPEEVLWRLYGRPKSKHYTHG